MLRLDINLVFTVINLIVLFLLMKKFLFGPVIKIMDERKALIEEHLANADAIQKDAETLKEQYEDTFRNADEHATQIVATAKKNAKEEYDRILQEADEKADKKISDAEKKISIEREKTIHNIQSEIAGLAMAAATKVVKETTTEDVNQNIYTEFLDKVDHKKVGDHNDTDIN